MYRWNHSHVVVLPFEEEEMGIESAYGEFEGTAHCQKFSLFKSLFLTCVSPTSWSTREQLEQKSRNDFKKSYSSYVLCIEKTLQRNARIVTCSWWHYYQRVRSTRSWEWSKKVTSLVNKPFKNSIIEYKAPRQWQFIPQNVAFSGYHA